MIDNMKLDLEYPIDEMGTEYQTYDPTATGANQ